MSTLETVDIPRVDILAAGGPYFGVGSAPGGDYYTVDDLKRFAGAAAELAGEVKPRVKLGHSKEQQLLRESGLFDEHGQPAAGWLENLRVEGDKLYADAKRVPSKIAALIKVGAFRMRSVEQRKYVGQGSANRGKDYGWIIDGLSLLGGKAPAVRTLDDIVALYSSDGVLPELGGEPPEGVRTVTFAAASISGAVSVTLTPEQAAQVAKALGIEKPEDLAPEKLHAAIETATKAAAAAAADPVKTELDAAKKKLADTEAELKTLKAAGGVGDDEGAKELAATLKKLAADAEQGVKAAEDLRLMQRDTLLDNAIRAGKLEPALRPQYAKLFDASPDVTRETIAALPKRDELFKVFGADGADITGGKNGETLTDEQKAAKDEEDAQVRLLEQQLGLRTAETVTA